MNKIEIEKKKLYVAQIKSTKERVTVYKHNSGGMVDYSDCKTIYSLDELMNIYEISKQ